MFFRSASWDFRGFGWSYVVLEVLKGSFMVFYVLMWHLRILVDFSGSKRFLGVYC